MSVADKQNLLPIYVEHSDWMDVDTEEDLKKAEVFLIESLKDKPTDGPVSKYINRKLSAPISKKLINPFLSSVNEPVNFILIVFICLIVLLAPSKRSAMISKKVN